MRTTARLLVWCALASVALVAARASAQSGMEGFGGCRAGGVCIASYFRATDSTYSLRSNVGAKVCFNAACTSYMHDDGTGAGRLVLSSSAKVLMALQTTQSITSYVGSGSNSWEGTTGSRIKPGNGTLDYLYSDGTGLAVGGYFKVGVDPTLDAVQGQSDGDGSTVAGARWIQATTSFHQGTLKRTGYYVPTDTVTATWASVGLPTAVFPDAQAVAPTTSPAGRILNGSITAASNGDWTGLTGPYTATRQSYDWRSTHRAIATGGSSTSNVRMWIGISSASLHDSASNPTDDFVAVRYDTGASDANWQLCSADGSTQSCVDSGVAVSGSGGSDYLFQIDCLAGGARCDLYVDGVYKIGKTNNLPRTTIDLGVTATLTNLDANNRGWYLGQQVLEQN